MDAPLHIAAATLNQTPIAWASNTKNIISAIRAAKSQNVDLLCLPEMALTGYGCEDLFLADWVIEKSQSILLNEILPETAGIIVNIGLPVKYNHSIYNCVCLISNQEILGFTAKQFLANDGVHYEHRWFTPWPSTKIHYIEIEGERYPFGDYIYRIGAHKIAFEICEDAWRPERPGILHHQNEVDIIINPSASPFEIGKTQRRQELVLDSSSKFDCTYVYCNLLGNESGRLIFDGEVLIAQKGEWIAANRLLSFADFNLISTEKPSLPNNLSPEQEFAQAVSLGLFDYLRKSRSKAFVLSLSGGADSSTCAVMVSEMIKRGITELGRDTFVEKAGIKVKTENLAQQMLITAYQGTKNSSEATLASAKELADEIGATFYHWKIDNEVEGYKSKIETNTGLSLDWNQHDIALQNIQARARSPIIWMLTNISQALLLTTSNRSEGDVGYATMDGDTSGSLSPIAGIDKTFIRNWLQWAEKELGYSSLNHVNNLTPSAELRPMDQTQSDESDLMPYEILVEIERLAIAQRMPPKMVFEKLSSSLSLDEVQLKIYIKKFFRLWSQNQWKRERLAPSFHLDRFNVDPRSWTRFPILSGNFRDELGEF